MTGHERTTPRTSDATSKGTRTGTAIAGFGFFALVLWRFIVAIFVFPRPEAAYEDCAQAVFGTLTHVNYSVFPTQIYCETAEDDFGATIYSFWGSAGLTSVSVLLVLVILYGMWMVVRREKNEPQPTL